MNIYDVDQTIKRIREKLDYQVYLTPLNFKEENNKFLDSYQSGKIYNPQYRYMSFKNSGESDNLDHIISYLKTDESSISEILLESVNSLSKEIVMYQTIGNNINFTESTICVYGRPNCDLLPVAIKELQNNLAVDSKENEIGATSLADVIKRRLSVYGFSWNVELLDNMASRVSVEPENRSVYINKYKNFTPNDIKRLIVHEIDTHVLRSENGRRVGFEVLASGTAGSLIHEEGLALYNEWLNNVQDVVTMRLYAARFIACCNIHLSFYDLFKMLISYGCSLEQAMYVVSRIKRGISDTSLPGGFIKDYVYYQGFYDIKVFLAHHPEAYEELYYGSISTKDIDVLKNDICDRRLRQAIILPIKSDI